MAFALDAIVNDVTYSLSDGDPFRLESAQGLAMPSVRRLTERGPRQDGDTDLGYRLDPRTITLSLNFYADTYAALDGHRDTLATIFKPARGYDIKLRVTRDDGAVRQIDCHTVGPVDVRLVREERPGKLHRAVVQLRAADPTWYDPDTEVVPLTIGPPWPQTNAYTPVSMSNVLDYDINPDIGQVVVGTVTTGNPWSFYFETTLPVGFADDSYDGYYKYLLYYGVVSAYIAEGNNTFLTGSPHERFGNRMIAGSHSYAIVSNGGTINLYLDAAKQPGTVLSTTSPGSSSWPPRWRSASSTADWQWIYDTGKVAFYDVALTEDQIEGLTNPSDTNQIAYEGDWPVYPTILLNGPITTPTIAVAENDMTLTFGTRNVVEGETWTIAWTSGTVTLVSSLEGDITDEMTGHTDWKLQPDPIAAGGTNTITITSGTTDGMGVYAGVLSYTPRFLSY